MLLDAASDDARSTKGQLAVCWVDITNVLGSVNHCLLPDILAARGLAALLCQLIADANTGEEPLNCGPEKESKIQERAGVKQGCSLNKTF